MLTKHFIKTLILFTGMIALGLLGIFIVSFFEDSDQSKANNTDIQAEIVR